MGMEANHHHNIVNIATNKYVGRASETLSGVTQLKIGDISLFIYVCRCTYVILYFDPHIFVLAPWSTPFHTSTKQNL